MPFYSSPTKEIIYKSLTFLGFPLYRVGSDGSVWSYRMAKGGSYRWKKLKGMNPKNNNGYIIFVLCNKEGQFRYLAHRLVLLAFVGPCPKGMEGCHNDGRRQNNDISNLRWDTQSGNQKDKVKHGTSSRGENNTKAKLTDEIVRWLRVRWDEIFRKPKNDPKKMSQNAFAKKYAKVFGVSHHIVSSILRNPARWPHIKI